MHLVTGPQVRLTTLFGTSLEVSLYFKVAKSIRSILEVRAMVIIHHVIVVQLGFYWLFMWHRNRVLIITDGIQTSLRLESSKAL